MDFKDPALLLLAAAFVFGMFEKVFDLLVDVYEWLIPFEVIDQFESGVVLRWGKYARTVNPGLRWRIPFGIEEILKDTVVRRTSYLDVQSLTSKDDVCVNISPIIIYKIGNIRRWLLEVDDAEDALNDVTYGIVDEEVANTTAEDINLDAFAEAVTAKVKEAGTGWGARVETVKFSDRSGTKALRLWTSTGEAE